MSFANYMAASNSQSNLIFSMTIVISLFGLNFLPVAAAKNTYFQNDTLHVATAYTSMTLPTLRRGDKGNDVKILQQILLDNGFLGAASARLKKGTGVIAIDGIFGSTTESAVKDLQIRYKHSANGVVTPTTWETIDVYENPYRSALPWISQKLKVS